MCRLKRNKQQLCFTPELQGVVPEELRNSILNTIIFALEPPAFAIEDRTNQQRQRILMRSRVLKLIEGDQKFRNSHFSSMLCALNIPSANAVGFWPQEDMWHFHLALSQKNTHYLQEVIRFYRDWNRKALELGVPNENYVHDRGGRRSQVIAHYKETLKGFRKVLHSISSSKESPFTVYHTYESYVFGNTLAVDGWHYYLHNYYSSENTFDSILLTTGDPIRNIKTFLGDGKPLLFLPLNAENLGGDWDQMSNTYNLLFTIYFFVNRKGQIVIHPFRFSNSTTKAFIIADALREW